MSNDSVPVLSFRNTGKTFAGTGGTVTAVDSVSLDLGAREFVCLLGPSGCGKSTLLNIGAGFENPTSGSVLFNGNEITGPEPSRGVVFQDSALFPWMTVIDNLTFGPRTNGVRKREAEKLAKEQMAAVGLEGFEGNYPAELSGGMQQRVQIARVLIMEPQLMLMDEPFGALDAQTRVLMQQLLMELWERLHRAVLFITHDVEESIYLADTIYVLSARPGRIKRRFEVNLPRPRDFDVTTSREFNDLKREIFELIREESIAASQMGGS